MKLIIPNIELSKEVKRLRVALWEFEKNSADFSIRIPDMEDISKEMSEYYSKGYPSLKAWGLPVLVYSKYLFSF